MHISFHCNNRLAFWEALFACFHIRDSESSHSHVFYEIGVLKNCEKFSRKYKCQGLLLINLQFGGYKMETGDSDTGISL